MPKEHKKRGRREEKKRKREQEEEQPEIKRRKSDDDADLKLILDNGEQNDGANYVPIAGPGEIPFYGLLDEEEQEYFKRADSMLELDQFSDAEERALFLANVYKEANGKELKIANSQSCSRLMERLILMSTPAQLKALFQKFTGHFLHLAQHRFASHCCETLFTQLAPTVSEEITAPIEAPAGDHATESINAEQLFLGVSEELEENLGYLMTDQFASHTLRVLLVVLSGRPLVDAHTTSLLQSKKKEHIALDARTSSTSASTSPRTMPDSFQHALDRMMKKMVANLDTTSLQALASHPVANPLLQILLDLEFRQSGKSKAKDTDSLFRKLLPDDPPEEGTDSASFFNAMLYDSIGSRLCEVLVTNSPGKTFKILYQSLIREKLESLAKNETASYVLIKALERLNKEDLEQAMHQICPQIEVLAKRSQTSAVKCLIERCQVRGVDTGPLAVALKEAYGQHPTERLNKMLRLGTSDSQSMSEERQKHIESHDPSKAHTSLLAQSMLDVPGPLQDLITDGILSLDNTSLQQMAKDRSATHVLQKSLKCAGDGIRYRRMVMPRLAKMTTDLATDPVASHVVDAMWNGTDGLPFIREKIAEHLMQHEAILRESVPGRAVWRNWQMDTYKTKRFDWMAEAKGRTSGTKTGIELARERFAAGQKQNSKPKGSGRKGGGKAISAPNNATGANAILTTLLDAVQDLLIPFIRAADEDATAKETGHGLSKSGGGPRTALVEHHKPQKLAQLLDPQTPETGIGKDGFLALVEKILQYSVNTWDQGFMAKLYASTDAPGVASDLILSVLNTNLHVYDASPALTIIEKATGKALASLFGLNGPHAGGISVQGGSASNTTSIVIARNTLYPSTKTKGIHSSASAPSFILFTSAHGHYSIEKASQMLGFGSEAVWSVPTDAATGRMDPSALESLIAKAESEGKTPFYVNATAGTTVLGSYDPIRAISKICRERKLWLHVDASWGGPVIFSPELAREKLDGIHLVDSIAINPHKMMGVPVTCSFLLGKDLREFHRANTLPADYLFHSSEDKEDGAKQKEQQPSEIYDLADLTLQCGRRGDALKLYLSWAYHGTSGYKTQIEQAFSTAAYFASLVSEEKDLVLVSENPPPCLQVCFFYGKGGQLKKGDDGKEENSRVTRRIARDLVPRGFMVDYACVDEKMGAFLRVVVNRETRRGTVEGLVRAVVEIGEGVW
ncbi:MAG: hypothetical protein Q9168_000834 [Polycauliona sp. 1 TL-2023]